MRNLVLYLEDVEEPGQVKYFSIQALQRYHGQRKDAIHTLALLTLVQDIILHPLLAPSYSIEPTTELVQPLASIWELLEVRAPAPNTWIYALKEDIAAFDR